MSDAESGRGIGLSAGSPHGEKDGPSFARRAVGTPGGTGRADFFAGLPSGLAIQSDQIGGL